jgi:hypothetical protein
VSLTGAICAYALRNRREDVFRKEMSNVTAREMT